MGARDFARRISSRISVFYVGAIIYKFLFIENKFADGVS